MEFTSFLQKKLGFHSPYEIEELILDHMFEELIVFSLDQRKALEQYTSLVHLSLNNNGISKLDNFPSLINLRILEINHNKIKGNDLKMIRLNYSNLYKLKISNNLIQRIECFSALSNSNLVKLEVKFNPFTQTNPNYIQDLFKLLPSIKVIDGQDTNNQIVDTTNYEEEEEEENSNDELKDEEEEEEYDEDDDDNDNEIDN